MSLFMKVFQQQEKSKEVVKDKKSDTMQRRPDKAFFNKLVDFEQRIA